MIVQSVGVVWIGLAILGQQFPPDAQGGNTLAVSVTPDDAGKAFQLYRQGVEALKNNQIDVAIERLQKALALYDHPIIRANLANIICDSARQDKTFALECHAHLKAALRYGDRPLSLDAETARRVYEGLVARKVEIEHTLAQLELSCNEAGLEVLVDGSKSLTCPDSSPNWLLAGHHSIVVKRGGSQLDPMPIDLAPGESVRVPLRWLTEDDLYQRPRWWVWVVFGAGTAAGVGGWYLHSQAERQFRDYDNGIAECATRQPFRGCIPSPDLVKRNLDAITMRNMSYVTLAASGGLFVGAGYLWLSNSRKTIDLKTGLPVSITPMLAPGHGGLVLASEF